MQNELLKSEIIFTKYISYVLLFGLYCMLYKAAFVNHYLVHKLNDRTHGTVYTFICDAVQGSQLVRNVHNVLQEKTRNAQGKVQVYLHFHLLSCT